jgi:demethylmenaquinone methyltransferase/2-methoxy-6-polyprenyl-1,4-benzoquinol methylase
MTSPPATVVVEESRVGVDRMFDRIAHRYDTLNRVLSFGMDTGWRKRALAHLPTASSSGLRVLDVATGTADVALLLLDRDDVAGVTGVDVSGEMLALGRVKAAAHPRGAALTLETGDATTLPFADGTFDAVTMAFGLRNVLDVDRALRELHRVLVPGGRAIVLEFGAPRPGPFAAVYERYRRHVLPRIGGALSGDANAYRYLDRTIATFPSGEALRTRFVGAGFARAWQEPLVGGAVGITVGERAGPRRGRPRTRGATRPIRASPSSTTTA